MERTRLFRQTTLALVLCGAIAAHAESEPEDIIKYRQNVMKSSGANAAAATAIVQGKVEFKDRLRDHAQALVTTTKNIPALFPKGSDFGETQALDAVWEKPQDFAKRAKDAQAKAVAFEKAVAANDTKSYAAKLKDLGDSCKACHKDYRKEQRQ